MAAQVALRRQQATGEGGGDKGLKSEPSNVSGGSGGKGTEVGSGTSGGQKKATVSRGSAASISKDILDGKCRCFFHKYENFLHEINT